ncbi:MAG: peptidoglycan-associated lipoprotein Pal [bacterium]|jgi:peptidoglycan-associated lipoprotein
MRRLTLFAGIVAVICLVCAGCAKKGAKVTIPSQGMGLFGAEGAGGIPLTETPEGPFAEPEAYSDPEAREVFVDVHFDYNRSEIRHSERPILEGIARYMQGHPQLVIKVEGHCDDRGSNEYNMALGERRALSIRSYLADLGVAPEKIYTISYGEERPLCMEATESCWARNRRGHFLLAAAQR